MAFKIHANSKNKNRSPKSTPEYSSVSAKLRLGTLVATLGLVLLAMNEARKPELWNRLGFGNSTPSSRPDNIDFSSRQASQIQENSSPGIRNDKKSEHQGVDDFWDHQFQQMSLQDKRAFVSLLKSARTSTALPDGQISVAKDVTNAISQEFESLVTADKLIHYQKEQIASAIGIIESIVNGRPTDSNDNTALARIQELVDSRIYGLVEDRLSMNREAEGLAWNRTWEILLDQHDPQSFETVSYLQLSGQPNAYRGQFVRVEGTARGAETMKLKPNHQTGLGSYKVLWVKPLDSNRTPYCIFTKKLPDDFPQPGNEFLKLNEKITVEGIFFKLRSYVASNNQVEVCPLLIADTIEWHRAAKTMVATDRWAPPRWLLVLFFVGMPLIAGLLARSVYRSTKMPRFEYGKNAQREIHDSLTALSSNVNVKSDKEKIQDLDESNLPDE